MRSVKFLFSLTFLFGNFYLLLAQNVLKHAEQNLTSFNNLKVYERQDIIEKITHQHFQSNPDYGICINDSTSWYELIEKRTATTRVFISPLHDSIYEYSAQPINFFKDGWWRFIDPRIRPSQNGWSAMHQEFPTFLNEDGSTQLSLGENQKLKFNFNSTINGKNISMNDFTVGDDGMLIHSAVTGIDKKILFRQNEIETDYIIQNKNAITNSDLIISEEIILPEGFTLERDFSFGEQIGENWMGELVVRDKKGNEQARFRTPVFYDSNKDASQKENSFLVGSYHLIQRDGKNSLEIIVPANWLNDASRVFPITIDPIVTGPTTTWAGGTIPSCTFPTGSNATINVTIPAAVTVSNVYVTSSYYANPATATWESDGYMWFTSLCGRDPANPAFYWTVAPPGGNVSGYAYLLNQDMHQTLACCFAPSCAAQTFALVMHLTRTFGAGGCNALYIYYNPATAYTFHAYVVGNTINATNAQWSVSPGTVCANNCNLTLTASTNYGIPPYTISHPWAAASANFGSYNAAGNPCTSGGNTSITLTIPGCPTTCGVVNSLSVPAPTITDACGNVVAGLTPKFVTVNPVPVATATPATQTVCSGDPVNIALSSCVLATNYSWNGSNGTSGVGSIATSLANAVCPSVTVTYTITPSTATCTGPTATAQVTVVPIPTSSFTVNPNSVCENQPVTITYTGTSCAGAIFNWNFNGATVISGTGQGPYTISWSIAGAQSVSLQVTQGACNSTTTTNNVTVNASPVVTINPNPAIICPGQNVILTASGATTYDWAPNTNLSASTGASVTASPVVDMTYTVTGTANGCTGTATVTVTITPLNGITCTPSSATICSGQNVLLTAGGATTYTWAPNINLSASTGTVVTASPTTTTTYTLTGTLNGCTGTTTVVITVNALSTVTSTPSAASICVGDNVVLTAGGAATYTWSPAAGLSQTTGSSVTASPVVTTTYILTGTNAAGCVGADTSIVTVNPLPIVTVNPAAPSICAGANVQLTASGASTYAWNPINALSNPSISNPVATPAATITYTVTGTSAQNCTASATVVVTVNPLPVVSFIGLTAVNCSSASPNNLVGNPAGGTYSGTGIVGNTFDPSVAGIGGPYVITYSYTDANGCSNTTTQNAFVVAGASITVSAVSNSICAGSSTTLTASGGLTYSWSPAAGLNTTTSASVTASPVAAITYSVVGIDINGCSGTATVSLTVNPLPIVTATGDNICAGQQGNISASGASSYIWGPNVALSSNVISNPIATPNVTTTYTVSGTDANGCVNTATAAVNVFPVPVVTVNPASSLFCAGQSVNLTASGALNYLWSPGTGLNTINGANVTATPGTTTVYTVIGTDANGCASSVDVTLTFDPVPVASFDLFPDEGCEPLTVSFQNTSSNGVTAIWQFGDGTTGAGNNTSHIYNAGTYDVLLITANASGCTDSSFAGAAVNVLASPTAYFNMDPPAPGHLPYSDNLFNFLNTSMGASTYSWDFGDNNYDTSFNTTHSYTEQGDYYVVLTAIADNGCTDTARSPLIMLDGEPKPWIPSAFTPNNDGTNDLFKIYGIAIGVVDFRVYDRWGEMVFQTTDPKVGWDGTFLGLNSSTDVYVYEARIKMLSGKKYLLKGDVTLIR